MNATQTCSGGYWQALLSLLFLQNLSGLCVFSRLCQMWLSCSGVLPEAARLFFLALHSLHHLRGMCNPLSISGSKCRQGKWLGKGFTEQSRMRLAISVCRVVHISQPASGANGCWGIVSKTSTPRRARESSLSLLSLSLEGLILSLQVRDAPKRLKDNKR